VCRHWRGRIQKWRDVLELEDGLPIAAIDWLGSFVVHGCGDVIFCLCFYTGLVSSLSIGFCHEFESVFIWFNQVGRPARLHDGL